MATVLPSTRGEWEKAIKSENVPTGLLSSADSFQSGSKFSMNDFLRLRIIHQSRLTRPIYTDIIFPNQE
ncbi:hypothetical protein ABVK25_009299 [Lepraria finkii]|uniref:Uncharacterized protein n=1 Tax=Lepraria finkii TaxID=1340010 RepID=A0ABR4AXT4_9LECA